MRIVVLKWDKFSVQDKIKKVRFVVQKMTENAAIFDTPDPPLTVLSAQADMLEASEAATADGGKDRTLKRDMDLTKMVEMMDLQVLYVQTVTHGDREMTSLAGMDTKSDGSKWPIPKAPAGFIAKPGEFEGSVYMKCNGTLYKKRYVFQMFVETKDNLGEWKDIKTQGKNIYLHRNLERGRIYRFRVYAGNSAGDGPVSTEATSAAR
ncbi:MAG: fibronectin type III domain-containing protein [Flavobacteriales bacterium]|nr:fibronectin type III domain-containing protein [Flavobacteriales bacterium]